ncbi:MAG: EamA family transporter, partial [Candidatus Zixiibacteriota bacterium]
LGLIAQVLGWLAIYTSLSKLPASRAALILLLQPTFASIWGALIFDETLTLLQLTGAALTLLAIYLGGARKS